MRSCSLLFLAFFIFVIAVIIAPLSFVTAYVPHYEKNLLSSDVTGIAKSEINITFESQIEVENTNQIQQNLTIYVPYANEDERQKVAALYTIMTLSNLTNIITLTNCSCNTGINESLCCEIVQTDDEKNVKMTFSVPKGIFNITYNITEYVKVNNSMSISSLNKTYAANEPAITKYLNIYDNLTNYDEEIKNRTIKLTENSSSDFEKVSRIVEYLYNNIEYDDSESDKFQNASWTFENKKGVCIDFVNLFLVMCRSINISARGIAGEIYNETHYAIGHAWAEVFIDKWYLVDPTFGEIGLVDGGRVGFTHTVSVSVLQYYSILSPSDLNITNVTFLLKFSNLNTTEWENTINVSADYIWINKTSDANHITNGTLQIAANITRLNLLNLSGAVTGMLGIIPPTSSSMINITVCEDNQLNTYFIIPEYENSTNVYWKFNVTNINLSEGWIYLFPFEVWSFLSNTTTLNVSTFQRFIFSPSIKKITDDNYRLNITVKNTGLRDGNTDTDIEVLLDNKSFANLSLFVEGGSKTNQTILNFTNVIGSHIVEIICDGAGFKFFIGNIENRSCKGDVNLDYKFNLNDAFELIEFIGGARNKTKSMRVNASEYYENCNKPEDADNNNVTDIFDVVKILETISQ